MFGRICFSNISISLNPANLAAVTYNSDFSFKVADLAKRANNIQSLIAKAIIALCSPPPNIPAIAIAINICGNAKKRSQIAINTSSKKPPAYPLTIPTKIPNPPATSTITIVERILILAAAIVRTNTSLPKASVPKM